MYGIVNKAIQGLVVENFGEENWERIKEKSGVPYDFFIGNDMYDDAVTYQLAGAASDVLNLTIKEVLNAFGKYWIMNTAKQHYNSMMEAGGKSLKEFLINLPNFHNRVALIYPKISPPEFKVTNISETGLHLHYLSARPGLTYFMEGLLFGLGEAFHTQLTLELLDNEYVNNQQHDVFAVNW